MLIIKHPCDSSTHDWLQIPLGVILKNENQVGEMAQIMESLHKYVPCEETTEESSGEHLNVTHSKLVHILMEGDQLTAS